VLLETLTDSQLVKKFPTFMEHEGSLSHSQVPATRPYYYYRDIQEIFSVIAGTSNGFMNIVLTFGRSEERSSYLLLSLVFDIGIQMYLFTFLKCKIIFVHIFTLGTLYCT
jgi:uncharacterized membrane protein YbjE (DUF340 family)